MERADLSDLGPALAAMLSHAAAHSPYYREQAWSARQRAGEGIDFREIPVTPKDVVRCEPQRFYASYVPPEDGEVRDRNTSGSTGEPLLVRKTSRHFQRNAEENTRLRNGWGFERHRRAMQISTPDDAHPIGTVAEEDLRGGQHRWTLYNLDASAAAELLHSTSVPLVIGAPSILYGALEHCIEASKTHGLQLIATVSEVVPDELRQLASQFAGCRLMDTYGSVETGVIAVQCPGCGAYHPADGHLVLELLTDEGHHAAPGELGRVIVTPLVNRAMPLLRYETGDYAMVAEPNRCPRSAIAIARIVGRERNLFRLPDGRRIAPRLPSRALGPLGVRAFKLFQTTATGIELHYVPRADDEELAPGAAQELVDKYMAPGFTVRPVRVAEIARARSGKYLTHECLI